MGAGQHCRRCPNPQERNTPHEPARPAEASQTRSGHLARQERVGRRAGGARRADAAGHRPGRHGRHDQPGGHQQRLLLLVLDRQPGHRLHEHGLRRSVQHLVAQHRQLRRGQGLGQRRPPDRAVLGQLQPLRQRVPGALRMDVEPARRVLHRRQLGHLPAHGRVQGHRHQRRRHLRHLQDDPRQQALRRGDPHLRPVLERPAGEADRRHHHDRQPLRRVGPGRDAARQLQLLHDHGHRGLPEQRQLQHQRRRDRRRRQRRRRQRERWRRVHRHGVRRAEVGRPVQPRRLRQRRQRLDGDDERAVPGEGPVDLERQRQLSQCADADRQVERQRQQLGRHHPGQRQLDLAQRAPSPRSPPRARWRPAPPRPRPRPATVTSGSPSTTAPPAAPSPCSTRSGRTGCGPPCSTRGRTPPRTRPWSGPRSTPACGSPTTATPTRT